MSEQRKVSDVGKILRLLNDSLPQAPGMTARNIAGYATILHGIPTEVVREAVYRVLCAWDKATLLPTPGTIRKEALRIMAKADALPTAEEAWEEVQRKLARWGVRGQPLPGGGYEPVKWSHSLIDRAVLTMGGVAYLSRNQNTSADRAHWLRYVYPSMLEEWYSDTGDQLALAAGGVAAALPEGARVI